MLNMSFNIECYVNKKSQIIQNKKVSEALESLQIELSMSRRITILGQHP